MAGGGDWGLGAGGWGEGDRLLLLRDHRGDGARRKRSQSPGVDVAAPGVGDGAGEFEDFGARPFGRVEPVVAQCVEFSCRELRRHYVWIRTQKALAI